MTDAPIGANKTPHGHEAARTRSTGARVALAAAAAFFFCVFALLGSWQVKRLQWKEDLIARVDARVHAAPVAAPGVGEWAGVTADTHEYRRVSISGVFLYELTTRVQTTTALGIGFWQMTPMCTEGGIVLVNRGFVAQQPGDYERPPAPRAKGDVCGQVRVSQNPRQTLGSDPAGLTPASALGSKTVTGLLRLSEPKGRVLRENDPGADRWYTRDIAQIAAARGLQHVAPFFIDADKGQEYPRPAEQITGGLTVIAFPNNHLVYALTWFALAAMVAGGYYLVLRHERRRATGEMDDAAD